MTLLYDGANPYWGKVYSLLMISYLAFSASYIYGTLLTANESIAQMNYVCVGGVILNLVLIATNAKHSPYGIAFNESQRLAIEADQTWKENRDDAGKAGLLAARSIALLSYRTNTGYDTTQQDNENKIDNYKASSYQRYQGMKLVNRFNAYSYWLLSKAMDSHNVGRNRGSIENALSTIKSNTFVIGIDTDFLFPVSEQKTIVNHIKQATYFEISSKLGHDGFLTESEKVSEIIKKIVSQVSVSTYSKVEEYSELPK